MIDQLLMVYATYLLVTASPGPSNMAIMATAMREGRGPALALAAGVVTGSACWALVAATGLAAVLTADAKAVVIIKVLGGLYLMVLAIKAWRSALKDTPNTADAETRHAAPPSVGSRARSASSMPSRARSSSLRRGEGARSRAQASGAKLVEEVGLEPTKA